MRTKLFIQVNIGDEDQKSGINKADVYKFYEYCKELDLDILGLMCIPPFNEDSSDYFNEMKKICEKLQLQELSMGMSSDYLNAIDNGSTYVRVGSSIFGKEVKYFYITIFLITLSKLKNLFLIAQYTLL